LTFPPGKPDKSSFALPHKPAADSGPRRLAEKEDMKAAGAASHHGGTESGPGNIFDIIVFMG
jgi:hypothetical protein